jgi:hypothetical protein
MITKEQYLANLQNEINIIRHLGTKIEPTMLDYRPSEKQRTMLELMNYLGHIVSVGTEVAVVGNSANYMAFRDNAPKVTLENFDQIMTKQSEEVSAKISAFSDEAMKEEIEFFGRKTPRADHLLSILKWTVAYKMQLFLYLKANGKDELGTMNLWQGTDPAPKE